MSDNPTPCGTGARKEVTRRSRPPVHPEDVQLALQLRGIQWICESLAHSVPGHRADPEELAVLMNALPRLGDSLRGYAERWLDTDDQPPEPR